VTPAALAVGLLVAAAAPPPLACPAGTEAKGAAPPDGVEEWCEARDPAGGPARREGPSRTYYDDGAVWVEATWRGGERHGPYRERHRNGAKAREGAFTNGRKTGRWTAWRESGRVEEEAEFRDGVPHGRFAAFWPDGRQRTEGRHCGGAQCGTWRTWDEAGRVLGTVDYGEQTLGP
jgi:antitoxin component YwqK of YwqJK toxin-antitoxin module